eukprot:gene6650-13465_t
MLDSALGWILTASSQLKHVNSTYLDLRGSEMREKVVLVVLLVINILNFLIFISSPSLWCGRYSNFAFAFQLYSYILLFFLIVFFRSMEQNVSSLYISLLNHSLSQYFLVLRVKNQILELVSLAPGENDIRPLSGLSKQFIDTDWARNNKEAQ